VPASKQRWQSLRGQLRGRRARTSQAQEQDFSRDPAVDGGAERDPLIANESQPSEKRRRAGAREQLLKEEPSG